MKSQSVSVPLAARRSLKSKKMEFLQNIDAQLLLFLNGMHCAFLDELMWGLTQAKVWIPMYVILAWVLQRRFGWSMTFLYAIILIACCIALSDQLCGHYIRNAIARPRPTNEDSSIWRLVHVVHDYRAGHYGFPSCHAANSFGLAAIVSLILRRRSMIIFIFVWATLHTYSRIYLGVHYPGDILAGITIGSIGSWLIYKLGKSKLNESQHMKTDWALPVCGAVTFICVFIYACYASISA